MGDLDVILDQVCRVARTGRPVALLFDYDGTLAPIRPTPAQAVLPPAARRGLQRLAASERVTVGVVSGRALADVRGMVGLDGVYYAGTSGLELDLLGRRLTPPELDLARAPLDQLAGRLDAVAAGFGGAWLEQKPFGLTLHYRAVDPALVPGLRRAAVEAMRPWAGRVRVEDVTLGIEVVPEVGWDKGTAVREILTDAADDPFPVYAGDSVNDVPAFRAVEALGGLSIGVGPNAPATQSRVCRPCVVGSMAILLASVFQDTVYRQTVPSLN
jgi:trehalose 6-phosphate phosphatase